MEHREPNELLLQAWVRLSWMVRNRRITKTMPYNEATVMLLLYNHYCLDGVGWLSIKEIVNETHMLKSLVNRTVNSLEEKGLLERKQSEIDRRVMYVRCVEERLDVFLQVHHSSLKAADAIIDIIGQEDIDTFIRIVDKIETSGFRF